MKKKAIISLVLIAMLAFGIGAGSFAWFTSQAVSEDNVFTAGELEIEANQTVNFTKDLSNIYPSWNDSNTITIKNVGTLPLKFKVGMSTSSDTGLFSGNYPLQIKINDGEWVNVGAFQEVEFNTPLDVDGTTNLVMSYRLPEGADNTYQGKSGTLNFTFDATQTENPGWTQEYTPVVTP
ncbi:MAG: TasA family protein [Lutispora sp.]|nr:TasA family protein [Lutispora sp.]MDD4833218.1 TasA family protein [Lutispora sp.]